MAALSTSDRVGVGAQFQSDASLRRDPFGAVAKADVQAAIAAADDWVEANKVSYNAALPLPARTQLSTAQKAQVLLYVVRRRFETGA